MAAQLTVRADLSLEDDVEVIHLLVSLQTGRLCNALYRACEAYVNGTFSKAAYAMILRRADPKTSAGTR